MIIAGYEYTGRKPFKDVYLTGIVRDKKRRKMSKSLGNSPDPLVLIAEKGADAVRTGMLFSSPAGNDLLFDEKLIEQGRNFANKIWNAFRLMKGWEIKSIRQPTENILAIDWFQSNLYQTLDVVEDHFKKFRISDALMALYKLVWDDYCSWYLEWVKPPYGQPIDEITYEASLGFFDQLMRMLHPFMPFITEELWQQIKNRKGAYLMKSDYVQGKSYDKKILEDVSILFEITGNIRNLRAIKKIQTKAPLYLTIKCDSARFERLIASIQKLANVTKVSFSMNKPENTQTFVVSATEFYLDIGGPIDRSAEIQAIEKELLYTKGFLKSVEKKLSNEKFVNGAPEKVVINERNKKADADLKIKALEESLKELKV